MAAPSSSRSPGAEPSSLAAQLSKGLAALEAGDIRKARLAAETANLAAPYEEIPKLDLAAVADAEGDHAEADRILREDVCNRTDDDDAPPEISDRTRRIVAARAWRERTRKAG